VPAAGGFLSGRAAAMGLEKEIQSMGRCGCRLSHGRCVGFGKLGFGKWCLAAVLLCTPAYAEVDRCVLVEDFSATWCAPCVYAGLALGQLQDEYPDDIATVQEHISDNYTIPWGTARFTSYPNHAGIPNVWFDGTLQQVGADPQIYPVYLDLFNQRQAQPTDVTIAIGGQQTGDQTFTFQVRVCLESGGVPKPVRVYLANVLDYHPAGGTHYRDCLMEAAATEDLDLAAGQCQLVERTFTFNAASWSQQADIRMIAWAQLPADSGVREVYQAHRAAWPFEPLPPLYDVGDLNCSGTVGFDDINPFVLYLSNFVGWQAQFAGCPPTVGDINGDGTYGQASLGDINPFVALLTGN
jgi:thiol-disulfide isomerase/thioredoxin